jgi:ATP-dependent helicase Lhr and Lhr-like helicase
MNIRPALDATSLLPEPFLRWFVARGWAPRLHQLELLAKARAGRSVLLIAPTGGGKTLAGFLPSLVELHAQGAAAVSAPNRRLMSTGRGIGREGGLHTLYVSPLKALAVDIARNLERPVADMGLPIRIETRTGDTPASQRQRQRRNPPHILLTTPEQLALLLASPDAPYLLGSLRRVVLDELHALVASKRGDLLSLGLMRLFALAPDLTTVGLSATVAEPNDLRRFLVPQSRQGAAPADLVMAQGGAAADITILDTGERLPWAGHSARYALDEIYALIRKHKTSLIFVNTRSQAERIFQDLWRINDDALAIALHHASLEVAQRRRTEAAMAAGRLRAVVATSSLDLGVDWGDIDLVVNVGAPKGASRLLQRIGRANHRMDEPSKGVLVPANRFEAIECTAARDAVAENAQDTPPARTGALDVLAQHVLGCACGAPFLAEELYAEVKGAAPFAALLRADFDAVLNFLATGGDALKAYERFARIRQDNEGRWRTRHPAIAQRYRMNVGTIVEADMLKVRLVRSPVSKMIPRGGRLLGKVEEQFIETLVPADTFTFAGEILKYEALVEDEVYVSRATAENPKVPTYEGGQFPLTTSLAGRVREIIADRRQWDRFPAQLREWLEVQEKRSRVPAPQLLIETFARAGKHHLVCYPFEGRLAHQTLGMLLTRRLDRAGLRPQGFAANEYALALWGLGDMAQSIERGELSLSMLFDQDMLGVDLEAWLAESALMKRTFRSCAVVAGLIERRFPGKEKSRREVTISTDLVYDVLRRHQPDHILLRAARAEAATGLLDIRRLGDMLARVKGRIIHKALDRVSPLAVAVMLEIGRRSRNASEELPAQRQAEFVMEAMQ